MGASPTVTDVAYPRLTGLTSGVRAKPMGPPAYGAEGLLKLRPIEVPITLPAGRDRDPGYQYPLCLAATVPETVVEAVTGTGSTSRYSPAYRLAACAICGLGCSRSRTHERTNYRKSCHNFESNPFISGVLHVS